MKGTIYGNRLPRGTQVKKGWELLILWEPSWCMWTDRQTVGHSWRR